VSQTESPQPALPEMGRGPDSRGRFGRYGGQYIPETLMAAVEELAAAFDAAQQDVAFAREFDYLSRTFSGRPTPVYRADRLTERAGGAEIWMKREDLCHTGAHKINNALGQVLLARRMGKQRIIAETGAGQHGVAVATVCAKFGLQCEVYMGVDDMARQAINV
jgi:tryptophan synthase beta chain